MINVEAMYQNIRDLTTKGKGGYTDSDEFNKNSKRAELLLWQYYSAIYERERSIPEAMYPFLADSNLPLSAAGLVSLPDDYGHFVLVNYGKVITVPGENPDVIVYPTNYLSKEEQMETIGSAIRKPSIQKGSFYYGFEAGGQIKIYPTGISGIAKLQYLRYPIYAVRGYTDDTTNDEQNYNPATSTQYEWPEQEENHLTDLILMFSGIIIKDSQIQQWASQQTSVTSAIIQ